MYLPFFKKNPVYYFPAPSFTAGLCCFFLLLNFSCANEAKGPQAIPATQAADTVTTDVSPKTTTTPPDAGTFTIRELACGKKVKIKENGLEAKLLAQITDKTAEPASLPQLGFDEVVFENGTSKLDMAQSARQLSNIAQIMTCYPNTMYSIGISEKNSPQLGKEKMVVIKATLIGLGVPPEKLKSGENPTGGDGQQVSGVSLKLLAK